MVTPVLASEMQQFITVSDDLILIPNEPAHLFSSGMLAAIATPDSVDATHWEQLHKLDPSSPRARDVRIESPRRRIGRKMIFARRKLGPETIGRLQAVLPDPSNYLGLKLLCSWDGEFTVTFWKNGMGFPISIMNSFTIVRERDGTSWWPLGSAGRLCSIMDEIFPELGSVHERACTSSDRDRTAFLDSERRGTCEIATSMMIPVAAASR